MTIELEQLLCPVCGSPVVEFDNSHKYIDLGLSVKWATCNMGALVPEECGDYYALGEITPKHLNNSITPLEHKLKRDRSGLLLRQLLEKKMLPMSAGMVNGEFLRVLNLKSLKENVIGHGQPRTE